MIINSSLIDRNFELLEEGHVSIERDRIVEVGDGFSAEGLDAKGYIIMPSLINSHVHTGDSFAKEAVVGMSVDEAVGPTGFKWDLYRSVNEQKMISAMRDSALYMLNSGITTFADFREGGLEGVNLLRKALHGVPIRAVILGRDMNVKDCDGLGLNINQLDQINQIPMETNEREGKIVAVHAGEYPGEAETALNYNPDLIIHFTHATDNDIQMAKKKNISVVLCPRSNALFGVGIPRVREMLDAGINLALGTDNVMVNSPDMFREMEFLSKLSHLNDGVSPRDILKMATVNGALALNLDSGIIEEGKSADLIFIDKNSKNLRYNKDTIATLVHRSEPENVRKVMINGKFVIDKDKGGINGL